MGQLSSCGVWAAHGGGFSCCGTHSGCLGSVVVAHGLSYSEARMQDLPGPGIKLVSPALAGRFFTTEPPGKPQYSDYF